MKTLQKICLAIVKIKISICWQIGCFFIKPKAADLQKLSADGQFKNILVCELNFIGDALLITPCLRQIKQNYPQSKITVLTGLKASQQLLTNNPNIDHLLTAKNHWQIFIFSLKNRNKFDILLDFSANFYKAFLLTLSNIPYRIGTKPKQKILLKNRDGFGWLYTHTKNFSSQTHIADYFLSLLEFLGNNILDNHLEIYLDDKEKKDSFKLLTKYNLNENQFLVLHPGVNDQGKAWNIKAWQELAQKLVSQYKLVFTGSTEDQDLIAEICQDLKPGQALNLAGKLEIRQTATLIFRAQAFIGVDTGPLHIAVSFNKPIVAIFNTTHPQNYLPSRNNIEILNTPEKCKQHFTLNYIKTKRQYKQNECSQIIKPQQVLEALEKLEK
ncbi:MAG: glycosyltransferase family 9 protein [Candidatus Parcubacteria bacterium]|nr:glycosyltransferase family 9 protein [Candidatus Parcubacteria bacterium]